LKTPEWTQERIAERQTRHNAIRPPALLPAAPLTAIKGAGDAIRRKPVPNKVDEARVQVARANRILANEGVLDAFGHVSIRHPTDPGRYLLSRSRAPELVQPEDVLEFTLDSDPVKPPTARLYGERVIHGEIYKARPEVLAVCHHHAPSILPFCISGVELKPVYHLGATMGEAVPFWDSRDEFGDTTLIVGKPEEGASLARALPRRDRRRPLTGGAGVPHHLHGPQRRFAARCAYPRPRVAAQRGGDAAWRRLQSPARAGGTRLRILVSAARQGRRHCPCPQGAGDREEGRSGS
jgi:hypothetical protein